MQLLWQSFNKYGSDIGKGNAEGHTIKEKGGIALCFHFRLHLFQVEFRKIQMNFR